MENAGIDVSGEEGEYHTVVTDGPIFDHEVVIKQREHILREGYCFLDISVISTDN
jgi:diphthine-ammonia ligase